MATSCSTPAVVAVTSPNISPEMTTSMQFLTVSIVFGGSIETGFELHGITLFDCGIISRMFSSMKLLPGRMFTTSLSALWNVVFFKMS